MDGEYFETGYQDLLHWNKNGWQVIDFKTDIIRNDEARDSMNVTEDGIV